MAPKQHPSPFDTNDVDMNGLATIVFDEAAPAENRESARQILERRVRAMQRRILILRGWRIPDEREFLDTAFAELMLWAVKPNREGRPRYDRSRPFGPWCRHWLTIRAMRRINRGRAARLEHENRLAAAARIGDASADVAHGGTTGGARRGDVGDRRWMERGWFRSERLPECDLSRIADWPPAVRLVLLVPSGLWGKLPERERARFVAEAASANSLGIQDLANLTHHLASLNAERLAETASQEFAEWLGLAPPHFTRLFLDNRWRLFELSAYRDFIRYPEPGPRFFATLFADARRLKDWFPEADWSHMGGRPEEEASGRGAPAGWRSRCLLLAMTGLWPRLPAGFWPSWFVADRFQPPFPPDESNDPSHASEDSSAEGEDFWSIDRRAVVLEAAYRDHPSQAMKRRRIATMFRQEQPRLLELDSVARLVLWEEDQP